MKKRPLPDSEEARSRKRAKWISRAAWTGALILGAVAAVVIGLGLF